MQQKFSSRGSGSFLLDRSAPAFGSASCDLLFRCPRCGERFRSLASMRAHLEQRHSYRSPDAAPGAFSITGKPPDPLMAAMPWYDMSLPARRGQRGAWRPPHVRSLSDSRDGDFLPSYGSARRRTQSVGVGTQAEGEEQREEEEESEEGDDEEEEDDGGNAEDVKASTTKSEAAGRHHFLFPPLGPAPDLDLDLDLDLLEQNSFSGVEMAAASAAVRRRLAGILRAADSTMQRRLARLSTDLVQTDTRLLCERAHRQHLVQQRQEVAEREHSLGRQVDVAVMVIAALREQLNSSENELERREREVLTIQKFLDAAARQETSGKVRIQRFIENLLRRIALAERLLEYYQVHGSPPACSDQNQNQRETGPHRISKSRSALAPFSTSSSSALLQHSRSDSASSQQGGRPPPSSSSSFRGPPEALDPERQRRERLAQSSKLFCRPEHRDDIWKQQRRRSAGYEA